MADTVRSFYIRRDGKIRPHAFTSSLVVLTLVTSMLISIFVADKTGRAQNYDKVWTTTTDFNTGTNSNIDTNGDESKLATTTTDFSEGFTGTSNKDAGTDANWDTSAHKLTLPGDPTNGVSTDLQAKWKSAVGPKEVIQSMAHDSTNQLIYIGGASGSFYAFRPSTGEIINLTSKISANWGAERIYTITFDSINGVIYLGGYWARFGSFIGGDDPANGTWTYLNSKITAAFTSNDVASSAFDSTNGVLYIGGGSGIFGSYTGGADPANGTFTPLTTKISTDWSNNGMLSMAFDSTNNNLYIGGTNSKFGAYIGGADPANGTWVNLSAKMNWSINYVASMTFDSVNGKIYATGETNRFGAFTGGSDPANGTFVNLSTKHQNAFNLNTGRSLTFDPANATVYIGCDGGRFGSFAGGSDPAAAPIVVLTAKISSDWSTNNVRAMIFDPIAGKVYFSSSTVSKAGTFVGGSNPANGTFASATATFAPGLVGYNITASATDTTNGIVYIGGENGNFASYNINSNTSVNLTLKISANWSTNQINAISLDSTNHIVYLGGAGNKFGTFNGGTDPENGTWTYLTTQLATPDFDTAGYWSTNAIYSLTFDSANGYVYVGGAAGRLGAVQAVPTPASTTTWTYLTTQLATPDFDTAGYWSTNAINAMSYDSTNGYVYLAGAAGRLGAIQATATPGTLTAWTYLTTQLATPDFDTASYWSTNAIIAIALDSANGYVYIGGVNGRFGAVQVTATPGSVTAWTYLTTQLITPDFDNASYFSNNTINNIVFAMGKIFIAGAAGTFGVFTGGAAPGSVTTWNYLYSNVSAINGTNDIRAMTFAPSIATIYFGSNAGKLTQFMIGYTSNKNGLSTKLNATAQKIYKATLTATETKPANTDIIYYLSNDGGSNWHAVASGAEFTFSTSTSDLRWKANLTTTNLAVTPEITAIAVNYKYFTSNTGSMNLTFDASQAVTSTLLSWAGTMPANTTLNYKIRSAATSDGLSAATWSDVRANSDTPVNLKTLNVGGIPGIPENQWYEVQIDFATTDGLATPTLSDITMQYVINQAPQLQNLLASQRADGSKVVDVIYELKDPDTNQNPYNQDQVSISLQYSTDSGSTWQNCATAAGTGLKSVNTDGSWTASSSTWLAGTDLADEYFNNTVKIKVLANDNEQAHNTAELATTTMNLDTTNPVLGSIAGGFTGIKVSTGANWTNDVTPDLALAASDDTLVQMEIRNDNNFVGAKEAYTTSKTSWALTANDGTKNIFVRFYDAFGNYTDAELAILLDTTAPSIPAHFTLFDTSNAELGTYTITAIWDPINNPGDFEKYSLERSTNGTDWGELATFSNLAADVYADKSLSNATTYYYRMRTKDIHENYSGYTEVKDLQPAGSDTVPPEITGPGPTSQAFATTANVTWITSEPADSYVEIGATDSYGSNQGSDELVTNHSVTVIGLQPTTTYHYRVKSRDGNSNKVTSADYTFTTTLSDEASESLTITGATAQKPGADPEEVTIIWTTDKYSTSQVLFGKEETLGQETIEDATLNKTHYITLTKLEPNTKYYYKVRSRDTYGNSIDGEQKYFVTAQSDASSPTTPSINYVEISDVTMTSAIISWQTTTVATSVVEIGSTDGYSGRIEDISNGSTTQHVVRVKDLTQGTEYHYRVMGQNAGGNWVASDNYKFSTVPEPAISQISIKNISSTTATISWKTNVPTDSTVDYGESNLGLSQGSSANVTDHEVDLISLKPATRYQFAIRIRDANGNSVISTAQTFQTIVDTAGPVIRDMKSETSIISDQNGVSKAQAIISWSTDEPSTAQVRYAMGVSSGNDYPLSTTEDTNLSTSHVIIISNLQASATYHMKLVSKDASGNISTSDDYTVLTLNQDKSLLQYIVQILEDRFSWLKGMGLF